MFLVLGKSKVKRFRMSLSSRHIKNDPEKRLDYVNLCVLKSDSFR